MVTTSLGKSAGHVWAPLRAIIDVDVMEWLTSTGSMAKEIARVLESAFRTYKICRPAPHGELPLPKDRAKLNTSIPIKTAEVLSWWAETKQAQGQHETKQAHILRALLTEAYHQALLDGWRAPDPDTE